MTSGIADAIEQARATAGDKDVVVMTHLTYEVVTGQAIA